MSEITEREEIVDEKSKNKIENQWTIAWKRLKKNKLSMMGLVVMVVLILIATIGPIIYPQSWEATNLTNTFAEPSIEHPLGTDQVGRDVLARVMYGGRISLSVGVIAVAIQVAIGTTLGIVAGYYGKVIDTVIMRFVDILMCFPFLPLLIMLGAVMSSLKIDPKYRMYAVMVVIGIIGWTGLCRLVRGQILSLREQEFMQAAESLGLSDFRKMFVHLLPNTLALIIVSATLGVGGAIMTESALSFLGLGVAPPIPSWGNMIQAAQDPYALQFRPWLWVPPGVCIFLTVIAINLFGDGLRDALDPKLKV